MVAFLLFQPKAGIASGLNNGQSHALFRDPSAPLGSAAVESDISNALQSAAQQTGAGFNYLLRTAMQESSLRPDAQAPTSSATGLFQFIESTWLRTVKSDGARFGLENFAKNIESSSSGSFTVRDPQTRADILALRNDPGISALMAGALAEDNATALRSSLGRAPNDG
ncbi:MAG: transglycosylase SLT domain-containing protein, partial [Fimbriimonadaceae bacterium]|nr:transglycosylase SLT domain-containing protein [Alphaproteobacteria bacterium]